MDFVVRCLLKYCHSKKKCLLMKSRVWLCLNYIMKTQFLNFKFLIFSLKTYSNLSCNNQMIKNGCARAPSSLKGQWLREKRLTSKKREKVIFVNRSAPFKATCCYGSYATDSNESSNNRLANIF